MTRRPLLLLTIGLAATIATTAPVAAGPTPTTPDTAALAPATPTPRIAPSVPRQVRAEAGDRRVTLTWRTPARGDRPTGYRIQRRNGGAWVTVRDLPASARRTVVRGFTNGQTARLRIAALSADGHGAYATASVMLPITLQIAAGGHHTCALRADSTVVCFGYNGNGQLGDGTTTSNSRPVQVRTESGAVLRGVTSIDSNEDTTCAATRTGGAWCWGVNDDKNLGDGTDTDRPYAVPVLAASGRPLGSVVGVTVSAEHTCVWLVDTTARCLGANSEGELGRGTTTSQDIGVPVTVLSNGSPLRGIVEMDALEGGTCARLRSGAVLCFGDNDSGQLGVGDTTPRLQPTRVIDSLTSASAAGVRQMDASEGHLCVRMADGTSRCTGRNQYGQLGNLSNDNAAALGPPLAAAGEAFVTPADVTSVVTGLFHTCLVHRTGRVSCTGANGDGQLLTIDQVDSDQLRPTFLAPTLPLRNVVSAAAGDVHTCVRLVNGSVRCAGHNDDGQLGNGAPSIREITPVRPIGL